MEQGALQDGAGMQAPWPPSVSMARLGWRWLALFYVFLFGFKFVTIKLGYWAFKHVFSDMLTF